MKNFGNERKNYRVDCLWITDAEEFSVEFQVNGMLKNKADCVGVVCVSSIRK